MGKGKKKSTVGFKYYATLHFAICHGTVDAIRSIWWGDKVAWSGSIGKTGDGSTTFGTINAEGLFGGEQSEGGAQGRFEFGGGSYDQSIYGVLPNGAYDPAKMTRKLMGAYKPSWPTMAINYRGLAVLFLHDNYIGNNAYLKDLSVEVERYWTGWRPNLCRIGDNMNPAHIVYECLTNEDWGLGYPASTIDDAAFTYAAQVLYNEGFGLSFVWDSDQDIMAFVEQVKVCIDASFYLNRRTGLWTLKLIRAGEASKMVLDTTNARLEAFSRKVMGETFNELSVKWTNPVNEEYETVTVQDPANIEAQGRVLQTEKEYVGVRTVALAVAIAQRDLQVASAQLATVEIVCNREAWALMPGDVVTFNWSPYGLSNIAMRVVETTQAEPGADEIRLQLVEDVFARASGSFAGVQPPGWVDPSSPPTLFTRTRPWEYPFLYVAQNFDGDASALPTFAAYGTTLASGGNDDARQVRLFSWVSTESGMAWNLQNIGPVTPTAVTSGGLVRELVSTLPLDPASAFRLIDAQENSFVLLCDSDVEEIVQVTAVDPDTGVMTIARGLMDTQPRVWPTGTLAYFVGMSVFVADYSQRSFGEIVQYKPAMQTSMGQMDPDAVPLEAIQMMGRYELPYPVANVTIGGTYWPTSVTVSGTTFRINWSTRNRLLQETLEQVTWDAASIVPEAGTTFGVQVLSGGIPVRTITGITGTGVDIPVDGLVSGTHTITIWAERDGRRNYLDYVHTLTLVVPVRATGYGNSYGYGYGL